MWSPDGQKLLAVAMPRGASSADWWVMPLDGTPPVRTGAFEALRKANLDGNPLTTLGLFYPRDWLDGETVVFSARRGDNESLWSVALAS